MGVLLQAMFMGAIWGLVWSAVTNYPARWAALGRQKRGMEEAAESIRVLFRGRGFRWGLCAVGGVLGFVIGMQPVGREQPSPLQAVILAGSAVVVAEWYCRRLWPVPSETRTPSE